MKNVFTDLDEIAKSKLIDAVYIASPNSLHKEQLIKFLNNKKHVLCEKPMASNVKEVNDMVKAARDNKVLLMEAMKVTFCLILRLLKITCIRLGRLEDTLRATANILEDIKFLY